MRLLNVLFTMLNVFAFSVLLAGCMPQGETDSANSLNEIPGDDDISVKTSVLCGKGRAVVGVAANGDVKCGAKKLAGLVGDCFVGEAAEALAISVGESDSVILPLCSVNLEESGDDVTLGSGPTEEFSCPQGTALVGFTAFGEALCGSVVDKALDGVALIMPADECPLGMVAGSLSGTDYSLPLCKYENAAQKQIKRPGPVVRYPLQANRICARGSVVIGFDENHLLLCGSGPKQFKKKVSRFIASEFDGHVEKPKCPLGYKKKELRLSTGAGRNLKLWTCQRDDL